MKFDTTTARGIDGAIWISSLLLVGGALASAVYHGDRTDALLGVIALWVLKMGAPKS